MTRPQRTREQKLTLLRHLGGEVLRSCQCAAALPGARAQAEATSSPRDAVVADALMEAMLLHARCVLEFLLRTPPEPGFHDCLRSDFFDVATDDWKPSPSAAAGRLNQQWPVINRHLSHLSWQRASPGKPWKYPQLGHDLVALSRAWKDHLATYEPELAAELAPYIVWSEQALREDG